MVDLYGATLPCGAVARRGSRRVVTLRRRHAGAVASLISVIHTGCTVAIFFPEVKTLTQKIKIWSEGEGVEAGGGVPSNSPDLSPKCVLQNGRVLSALKQKDIKLQSNLDIRNLNIRKILDIRNFLLLTKISLHKESRYRKF